MRNTDVKTGYSIKSIGFDKPKKLGVNGRPIEENILDRKKKPVNEYYVELLAWDYIEAASEEEAAEILKDRIRHVCTERNKVELNASDIYNPESPDYIDN